MKKIPPIFMAAGMRDVNFDESVKHQSVICTKPFWFGEYLFVFLYALVVVLLLSFLFTDHTLTFTAWLSDKRLEIWINALSLGLLIKIIFTYRANNKLISSTVTLPTEHTRKVLEKQLIANGWNVGRSNSQLLIAFKTGKFLTGSQATILFYKQTVYINVQNLQGFRGYFPFSFGRNKRIRGELMKDINQCINNNQ